MTTRSAEAEELISITNALLGKRATSEAVRAAQASDIGYDPQLWATLCEQIGVAALPLPEEYDGAEASLNETGAVLEALAYHLVPTPLFTSTLAQCAVLLWGTNQARTEFLPRMASGEVATVMWPGLADGALLNPSSSLIFAVDQGQLCAVAEPEIAPEATMDQGVRIGRLTGGSRGGDWRWGRCRCTHRYRSRTYRGHGEWGGCARARHDQCLCQGAGAVWSAHRVVPGDQTPAG
ncbi:MAG: acyl-CoA dehydrogenase family protein [Marmoricola sp.]